MKLSDQAWSYIFLLTGCAMILICKHFSITEDVGAGIVGAGINAYTATQKAEHPPEKTE